MGKVSQPKKEGSLGIGGIVKKNIALWEMALEIPAKTIHFLSHPK